MLRKLCVLLALAATGLLPSCGCSSETPMTSVTVSDPVPSTPAPDTLTETLTTPTTTSTLPNYGGAIIPADEGQGPAEIRLYNYESRPNVLIVKKGTTVTWVNHDYWKPLTVVSDDGLFASNVEPTGGDFSYLFENTGSFGYSIDPYSGVWQGVVIVVE